MFTTSYSFSPADKTAVATALVLPTLVTWFYFVAMNGASPGWQQVAAGLGKTIQFAFPLLWLLCRPKRTEVRCAMEREDGKQPGARVRGLVLGAGFGLLVFAVALAVYGGWLKPCGYLDDAGRRMAAKVTGFGVRGWPQFAAMGVFYALLHSLLEEYYWRWFVFGQLRRWVPPAAAIAGSSLAFTSHHLLVLGFYFGRFSLITGIFSLAVAIGGVFWAWLYQKSGSLYGPWLSHALVDAALFLIGYDLIHSALH